MFRSRASFFVILLALCLVGCEGGHAPGVLNDTPVALTISARIDDRWHDLTLAPHTAFFQGVPDHRLTSLTIRYADGHSLLLGSAQLDAIRKRAPVKDEFWVIRASSVELVDIRDAKRFRVAVVMPPRPNQAMQPTTGWREDKFSVTQPLPLQPTRAPASGG